MMTDPISDMLARLRNASAVKKTSVSMPFSKMKHGVAKILEKEGFVGKVEQVTEGKFPVLRVELRYAGKTPRITHIKRVSKPGLRVYRKADELPRVLSDNGIAIVSTPNGLMTNKEARARRLGGEIVCEVY
jgi:small subunit ribosomal protein S8